MSRIIVYALFSFLSLTGQQALAQTEKTTLPSQASNVSPQPTRDSRIPPALPNKQVSAGAANERGTKNDWNLKEIVIVIAATITSVAILGAAIINSKTAREILRDQIAFTAKKEADERRRDHLKERRQLAGALLGEIDALRYLVTERRFVERFSEAAQSFSKGGPTSDVRFMAFVIEADYFTVYRSICDRIGCFSGHLPQSIARFYTEATGAIEWVNGLTHDNAVNSTNQEAAEGFSRAAGMFSNLIDQCSSLCADLSNERQKAEKEIEEL